MPQFSALIYKLGINPVVDPPEDVLQAVFEQAGRAKGPIPVRGLISGAEYVQTLVKYGGKWRLYINGEMLKASGLKIGDTATIEIEHDPRPRIHAMPAELKAAFEVNEAAKAAFSVLTPSRRNEILRYIGSLKTEASRRRKVDEVVKQLTG